MTESSTLVESVKKLLDLENFSAQDPACLDQCDQVIEIVGDLCVSVIKSLVTEAEHLSEADQVINNSLPNDPVESTSSSSDQFIKKVDTLVDHLKDLTSGDALVVANELLSMDGLANGILEDLKDEQTYKVKKILFFYKVIKSHQEKEI